MIPYNLSSMVYGAGYKQSLCLYGLQLFLGSLQSPKKTSEIRPKTEISAEILGWRPKSAAKNGFGNANGLGCSTTSSYSYTSTPGLSLRSRFEYQGTY